MVNTEFDLLKHLKDKTKIENVKLEGAIVAFRDINNGTGTVTITEDFGVRLRLIQEADIQKKILDFQIDRMVENTSLQKPKESRRNQTYFG